MLEQIAAGAPAGWVHAAAGRGACVAWARACARIVVADSAQRRSGGRSLLGVERDKRASCSPTASIPSCSSPPGHRQGCVLAAHARARSRGMAARGADPGSVRLRQSRAGRRWLDEAVTLIAVGRYTAVKR